jgi:hypothetical protein
MVTLTNGTDRTWSMQAASDRDQAILVVQEARARIYAVRALLQQYDTSLALELDSFSGKLNGRLGALLVAREDAL